LKFEILGFVIAFSLAKGLRLVLFLILSKFQPQPFLTSYHIIFIKNSNIKYLGDVGLEFSSRGGFLGSPGLKA